jgi:hypothetical protein
MFLFLVGLGALALAAVYWHHLALVNQSSGTGEAQVHTDVIFVFSAPPLAWMLIAILVWLLCIVMGYLWLKLFR